MLDKKFLVLCLGLSLLSLVGCDGAEEREVKYLNRAQAYFDKENYEKMQVELKNVLQINPKNTEARYLTALAAEKTQDWRRMFGNLSAVIEERPDHYDAQVKIGKLMLFSKNNEKASEKVELVLANQPNHSDALALKATIHLSEKETDKAKAILNKVLELDPGHYDASLLLIKILGDEKKIAEAKKVLENAMVVHPDKLKLSLVKINILMIEDKKDEAEALYQSLLQQFPENESLYYSLVKLYLIREKTDQAEGVLKNMVALLPENDRPKFVLIDFLTRQRGAGKAKEELDHLIAQNPDNFGFRFAKLSLYKDQPEKIEQILQKIIEDDKLGTSGIDARNKLASFYNSKGDSGKARELIDEVIELDTKNATALLFRAGLLMKNKEFDAAIADARTILRDDAASEKALLVVAVAQLQINKIELAEETFEKILQINPKNAIAVKDLVRIKVQRKDEVGAITLLEKSQTMFKDDRDLSIMLIDLYGKSQQWGKAEVIANRLLGESEAKEIPHYKLAQLYMGQKKYGAAVTEFQKILDTKPNAPDVLAGLVNSYLALKQDKKAEKLLDDTLVNNKDNPAFLTMRAELYRRKKQLPEAEQLFKKVVDLNPNVELGYKNLASIYLIQKQIDRVISVYQQGLQTIPESNYFLMQLGILNTVNGDAQKAIDAYQKLLVKVPNNLLAANNLAVLLVETGDQDQIVKANTLISPLKDSKYASFLDTYGWVSFKNGQVGDALVALESALKKKGVIPEMHYHLGMVYMEKGRTEEAKLELEKSIADGAKFKEVNLARSALEKLAGSH